jgi:hypothetical protein
MEIGDCGLASPDDMKVYMLCMEYVVWCMQYVRETGGGGVVVEAGLGSCVDVKRDEEGKRRVM